MRATGLIALSLLVGVLLAGVGNAALVSLLPAEFRGTSTLWAATAFITAITTTAFWFLLVRKKS